MVSLVVIGGVSLDAVSHEESVGAGGDEGMTRSHNLKAQETECTQHGGWGETRRTGGSIATPSILSAIQKRLLQNKLN